MRGHRSLAVGRDPGRGKPAILTRTEADRALAGLLEHKGIVVDMTLASRPGGRVLLIDARPDRVDRGQVVAMHRFDPKQDLAAVRIKPVPGIPKALRRLAGVA